MMKRHLGAGHRISEGAGSKEQGFMESGDYALP